MKAQFMREADGKVLFKRYLSELNRLDGERRKKEMGEMYNEIPKPRQPNATDKWQQDQMHRQHLQNVGSMMGVK